MLTKWNDASCSFISVNLLDRQPRHPSIRGCHAVNTVYCHLKKLKNYYQVKWCIMHLISVNQLEQKSGHQRMSHIERMILSLDNIHMKILEDSKCLKDLQVTKLVHSTCSDKIKGNNLINLMNIHWRTIQ